MMDALEMDRKARETAQREFRLPIVVEAGAGTGKTTLLAARIVCWCTGPGWSVAMEAVSSEDPEDVASRVLEGVVAITFTESAAAEMEERLCSFLSSLAEGRIPEGLQEDVLPSDSQEVRRRARALLSSLERVHISTIHSFCMNLLSHAPLESGLHPFFRVDAEGLVVEEVAQVVVEERFMEAVGSDADPHWEALIERDLSPEKVAEALRFLLIDDVDPEVFQDDPFGGDRLRVPLKGLSQDLEGLVGHMRPVLLDVTSRAKKAWEVLLWLKELKGQTKRSMGEGGCRAVSQLCSLASQGGEKALLKRLRDWSEGRFSKTESELFGEKTRKISEISSRLHTALSLLSRMDPELLDHARKAFGPLLKRAHEEMRRRGAITFSGLLRRAWELLYRHPQIARRFRRSMDQLLVDEFQDTDPIQCQILQVLALEGEADERPGLFIVGDPKQSVFGWRDADLEAYEDFVEEVLKKGGMRLHLTMNFRSVPAILDEVQRVVSPVMQYRRGLQPSFEPLVVCPRRSTSAGFERPPWGPVEYWISGDEKEETDEAPIGDATEIEAEALAADIARLHSEAGVSLSDICVLMRSTSDLDVYLGALKRWGVPYCVTHERSYFRRREVVEAISLIRCILDPQDQLALLAFIRSAMVGVPDCALFPLWREGFPRLMSQLIDPDPGIIGEINRAIKRAICRLSGNVPGLKEISGWEFSLEAAVASIEELRWSFRRDPPDVFVECLRALLLPEATEAARYLGAYRLANLDRLFGRFLEAMEEGGSDPQEVLRWLRKSVWYPREFQEGRPRVDEEAVQVMTIHKAKGLDFGHVYLVQVQKRLPGDQPKWAEAKLIDGCWEYSIMGAFTPGYIKVMERRRQTASAELVRTLYVAMTRAKERLVISGRWPREVGAVPEVEKTASHLDLLCRREMPHELRTQPLSGGTIRDKTGVIWRLLDSNELTDTDIPIHKQGSKLPEAETIRMASINLRRLRREASARMERPLGAAASEEAHKALSGVLGEGGAGGLGTIGSHSVATAVGGAVHRALEGWDLDADPDEELERHMAVMHMYVPSALDPSHRSQVVREACEMLRRFRDGPLLKRLISIRGEILARELPVVLPVTGDSPDGPIQFLEGSVDLVYRDPQRGRMIVVDYKTDRIETPEEIKRRAAAYALQGRIYARALKEGLALNEDPAFEIWFIYPGITSYMEPLAHS